MFPLVSVIFNYLLIEQVKSLFVDKAQRKLTLVSLLGKHDATFLFVVFTVIIEGFAILDTIQESYFHLVILSFYAYYSFNVFSQLMSGTDCAVKSFEVGGSGFIQQNLKYSLITLILYFIVFLF